MTVDQADVEKTRAHVATAKRLAFAGDGDGALRECAAALSLGVLRPGDAVLVVAILRSFAEASVAREVEQEVRATLQAKVAAHPDQQQALLDLAQFLLVVNENDAAEPLVRRAIALDPSNFTASELLAHINIERKDPDAVVAGWQPLFAARPDSGKVRLIAAKILGHFGYRAHAEQLLALAEPLSHDNIQEFRHIAAGIRGVEVGLDQAQHALALFDTFSSNYDAVLTNLRNAGPQMIGWVLDDLALPRDTARRVLDAGCGTGLCAPYLRPYASLLHGCDLSVGMLEQAKAKGTYDLLTRTDLSIAATYPEGVFDLVASSDVLVYFGDLGPVLKTVATRMRPGGWLVISVEDGGDSATAERGYLLGTTGRYAHRLDYLERTLQASGFARPKVTIRNTLRHEFNVPVAGIALAAQRLALV